MNKELKLKSLNSKSVLAAFLILILSTTNCFAEALVTDRPDQTESSVSIKPGYIQIETGWTYTLDKNVGIESRAHEFGQSLVRIGMFDRVELRITWDGYSRVNSDDMPSTLTGSNDAGLGAKIELWPENGGAPEAALLFSFSLPVGADGLTSDKVDLSGRISLAHTLSESVSLGYNFGFASNSTMDSAGLTTTPTFALYTVALGSDLAPNLGGFVEVFGDFRADESEAPVHSLDGGFTYLFSETLQADLAGGVGLSSSADDWFITAGLSVLFSVR